MAAEVKKVQLPLTALIEILESEGFRIGIDLRLKLQQVLLHFWDEIRHDDLNKLKYYLRPLVAKSQIQQVAFDRAFEKYTRYIAIEAERLKQETKKPLLPPPPSPPKPIQWIKKHKASLLAVLGSLGFLAFALFMNTIRDLPNINLAVSDRWISVGDSLRIEGMVSGMLVDASIFINDTPKESGNFFGSPKNDIISHTEKFLRPGTYDIKFSANNKWVSRDTTRRIRVSVCANKPEIDFTNQVDSLNPLKVSFVLPNLKNISGDLRLSMLVDGQLVEDEALEKQTDSILIYEFGASGVYDVEFSVIRDNVNFDSICDFSAIRKNISLNSVILGTKKDLVRADPTQGRLDLLDSARTHSSRLNIGVLEYKNGIGLRESYGAIFESLVDKLEDHGEAEISLVTDRESLSKGLLNGTYEIGVYTPVTYLDATQENPELAVSATHQIAAKNYYNGYIITRKDLGINELNDLESRHFTFVKETSTSGYWIPLGNFRVRGFSTTDFFSNPHFSKSHKNSIALLQEGKTDGIAVDESRWNAFSESTDASRFKILDTLKVPYNAYVFSPKLSNRERDRIRSILVDSIQIDSENPLGIENVLAANDESYNPLRKYLGHPRRMPAFMLNSITIGSKINVENLLKTCFQATAVDTNQVESESTLKQFFTDSIYRSVKRSGRFAEGIGAKYRYTANLELENSSNKTVRYNIFLNNQFISTGELNKDSVCSKLPIQFTDDILNALPIQTELLKGTTEKGMFIPYGKTDGINTEDYIYTISGDTIATANIRQTELDTHFSNLDGLHEGELVGISYPSPNTDHTQYFNIYKPDWDRVSNNDLLELLFAVFGLVILPFVCLEFFYFRRRKIIPSKEVSSSLQFEGIKPPYDLELPEQNDSIRPEKELYALSRRFKQRTDAGRSKIDVSKSIEKTAENAGFVKLFFKETTKVPEYLVLVDSSDTGSFHKELFSYLNKFLQNEDAFLDVFYYDNSPRFLKNLKHPEGISLEALSEKYPDHILLIMGDGEKLINTKFDRLFRWASEGITKWKRRFHLTPKSFREWDLTEHLIDQFIPVFPATLKGLMYMSENLAKRELPDFNKRKSFLQLVQGQTFYSYETLKGIKEFLKEPALFQWFCCLAIYPKLHWPFVIAIGRTLSEKYATNSSGFKVNYKSLFKISEVSHLLENDMDEDLRVELLENLDPNAERIARQAILNLLKELKVPKDSYIFREVMVQSKVNHSLLSKDSQEATTDLFYLWKNNLIEDRATKVYLAGSSKNLWNKKADDFFSPVDYKRWKPLLIKRGPVYIGLALLVLSILNLTLFQNIIKPQDPVFAIQVEPVDSVSGPALSSAAIYNNEAVDIYDLDNQNVEKVNNLLQLAIGRDSSLAEAQYNMDVLKFNEAIDSYLARDFESAKNNLADLIGDSPVETSSYYEIFRSLFFKDAILNTTSPEVKDSFFLESAHYVGLSDYYLGNLDSAESILKWLKSEQPEFLENYYPNLGTLLDNEQRSICDKYDDYSAELWRKSFLKETQNGTWHVFVESLSPSATQKEAEKRVDKHRNQYPNLDFNVMYAMNLGKGYTQYTIVIAEGLSSSAKAQEIASFANDCGIGYGAFAQQQIESKTAKECTQKYNLIVRDRTTNRKIIQGLDYMFFDNNKREIPGGVSTDRGGTNTLIIECNNGFLIRAQGYGYLTTELQVTAKSGNEIILYLQSARQKDPDPQVVFSMSFSPIYFDFGKISIRRDAEIELQKLVAFMEINRIVRLQVQGHTASRGDDKNNLRLSERRARAVVDYLIANGIAKNRLLSEGFGETRLVNECANDVKCSEREHQLNNRVEFIVLEK